MGAWFDETSVVVFVVVVVVLVVFVVVEAPTPPLRRLYGFYYYYPSSPADDDDDDYDDDDDDDYFSPLLISFCCFSSPVPPLPRSRGDCSRLNRSPPFYLILVFFFPPPYVRERFERAMEMLKCCLCQKKRCVMEFSIDACGSFFSFFPLFLVLFLLFLGCGVPSRPPNPPRIFLSLFSVHEGKRECLFVSFVKEEKAQERGGGAFKKKPPS